MAIVIAECCQNHKGDQAVLKDMVHAAAAAGADYVKIQSMLADDLTHRERFENGVEVDGRQKAIKRPYQAEYDRLKPMDLDDEAHFQFIEECRSAGIKPLTTAFSRSRVPFIEQLPWTAIKVASYDCGSVPFLRELKEHFDTFFVSTGSTFDEEIESAAEVLRGTSLTLLHCVTIYPTPLHELHLARIDYLRTLADRVGFSDHSLVERDGLKASIAALAYGADVVERHFTVLPRSETKDGPVSINPSELEELVRFAGMDPEEVKAYAEEHIPEYPQMIGMERRELSDTELLNRDYYRGRFASRVGDGWVYNWEEKPLQ